jgi:hypothetical protein
MKAATISAVRLAGQRVAGDEAAGERHRRVQAPGDHARAACEQGVEPVLATRSVGSTVRSRLFAVARGEPVREGDAEATRCARDEGGSGVHGGVLMTGGQYNRPVIRRAFSATGRAW